MKLTTIVVSGAFILIVATLLNIGQLYFMAGMLSAIPLVCYAAGRRQNRRVEIAIFASDELRAEAARAAAAQ